MQKQGMKRCSAFESWAGLVLRAAELSLQLWLRDPAALHPALGELHPRAGWLQLFERCWIIGMSSPLIWQTEAHNSCSAVDEDRALQADGVWRLVPRMLCNRPGLPPAAGTGCWGRALSAEYQGSGVMYKDELLSTHSSFLVQRLGRKAVPASKTCELSLEVGVKIFFLVGCFLTLFSGNCLVPNSSLTGF